MRGFIDDLIGAACLDNEMLVSIRVHARLHR